ncbi:hypothetical protein AA13595_0884 [Gluconacetobacter johannae DSM 13595]|nr:hypothetical protein AA13595_0884 [Gluconacetobacter johannae DSM 13595]
MAPLFDNGTSLGYEHNDSKIQGWGVRELERYVSKGTHHCSWVLDADKGTPHIDLCEILVQANPEAGTSMQNMIRFGQSLVDDILQECCSYSVDISFTPERAAFVRSLLGLRQERLGAILGG